MRRTVAPILLALVCAASLAGCARQSQGTNDADDFARIAAVQRRADDLAKEINSFTDELLSKVESAADTKAGVEQAQEFLNARKDELAARVRAFEPGQVHGARGVMLEAEVDNTDRVHRLQLKYSDAAARDPELKAGLNRLVADYDALFSKR
jgi:hypothetical protein